MACQSDPRHASMKKKGPPCKPSIQTWLRLATLKRWQSRFIRWTNQRSMTYGVLCKHRSRSAGDGMPLSSRAGSSWRLAVAPGRYYVFLPLQTWVQPFGVSRLYTDHAGGYQRHLSLETHEVGKPHTQKIERQPLTLRTRIKRLARKTLCCSKSIRMHDIVLGLFMNRDEFALTI